MSVNGTLVEAKMCIFTLESTHFSSNKCSIYTHHGANAKFSTDPTRNGLQCKRRAGARVGGWDILVRRLA